ncbi:MAG: TIGR01548 family HAD-type hydrolase [Leptolyngbyaceae bacterium]|nr:TIGR01548 family HAD-type hydrolase [Leptolyngbyaceae bacterium]
MLQALGTELNPAILVFDIDGVVRDVGGSYRRALADTVENFTEGQYRPTVTEIDTLKTEGIWNNDWEASRELVYRYFKTQRDTQVDVDFDALVAFFQSRYRGTDPEHWNGYICQEPLLMHPPYLASLTEANIAWGFFSGATRGSANYVLEKRLGLQAPVLVAMEDAPGKPDPTGLFDSVRQLEELHGIPASAPVLYAGDTVADLYTVQNAQKLDPSRTWIGIGILPPHVQDTPEHSVAYGSVLKQAGATVVFSHIEELTPTQVYKLIATRT